MARVVDYAWGRPGIPALKAAGAIAVCRYLSRDTTGKTLSRAEADGLRAGGIDVVSNWEQAGSWGEYSGGQAVGRSHAVEAARQHMLCGAPLTRPIYFSTDWDATDAQLPTVAEYYRGVSSVIGLDRTGAYGSYRTIHYLFDHGVIRWGWQTYAWSAGQWDFRAHLRQVRNGVSIGGVDCDLNDSMSNDFGQWGSGIEVDVTPEQDMLLRKVERYLYCLFNGIDAKPPFAMPDGGQITNVVSRSMLESRVAIATLAAVVQAGGGSIDVVALSAKIDAAVAGALTELTQQLGSAVRATADQLDPPVVP